MCTILNLLMILVKDLQRVLMAHRVKLGAFHSALPLLLYSPPLPKWRGMMEFTRRKEKARPYVVEGR